MNEYKKLTLNKLKKFFFSKAENPNLLKANFLISASLMHLSGKSE